MKCYNITEIVLIDNNVQTKLNNIEKFYFKILL